jgi:hypothetical protein
MPTTVTKMIIRLTKRSPKTSITIDLTAKYNKNASIVEDISGYDFAVLQIVTPSTTIAFNTTNDNGGVTGTLLPSPQVPANWTPVFGLNLQTNVIAINTAASGIWRFEIIGQFLQIV